MSRWLCPLVLLVVSAIASSRVLAGPNEGGTLILHRNASLVYTSDQAYCGQSGLTSCEVAVVNAPADAESIVVFFAMAAFPDGASPRLKGLAFGIHYDANRLALVDHGPCVGDLNNGGAEFPGSGWPADHSGTSLVFQNTQTSALNEVYWFVAYAYSGDPAEFQLTAHPDSVLGGVFADDAIPSALDSVTGYGSLGFGTSGYLACPVEGEGEGDGPNSGDEDPVEDRQVIAGHVPADIEMLGLEPIGQLADTTVVHLAIELPLPDKAALADFIERLYD